MTFSLQTEGVMFGSITEREGERGNPPTYSGIAEPDHLTEVLAVNLTSSQP